MRWCVRFLSLLSIYLTLQSSREFIQDFDASPDVRAAYYCNNLQEAEALVGKQAVHGVLYFPSDFDRTLHRGEKAHVGVVL